MCRGCRKHNLEGVDEKMPQNPPHTHSHTHTHFWLMSKSFCILGADVYRATALQQQWSVVDETAGDSHSDLLRAETAAALIHSNPFSVPKQHSKDS